MKKAEETLKLSRKFWDGFKLFLQEKITRNELKQFMMYPDDLEFYKRKCHHVFNVRQYLPTMMRRDLEALVDKVLSEVEKLSDDKERKALVRKVLMVFLGNYSSLVEGRTKQDCKSIMNHFTSSFGDMDSNGSLDEAIQEMVSIISAAKKIDEESHLMRPIVFKLICLYIYLAETDKKGREYCFRLCSDLSFTFGRRTPKRAVLPYLKKREKNVSDRELLERFSFWIENGVIVSYDPVFFVYNMLWF